MAVIGLTGNIACGKTTVAKILAGLGCHLIDADQVARDVVEPGAAAYDLLKQAFGEGYFAADGTLDRGKLGAMVFSNPQALALLNSITHPAILAAIANQTADNQRQNPNQIVVVEAALLIEAKMLSTVDKLWFVYADDEIRLDRLMGRDGLNKNLALARINSQMPQSEKMKYADYIVHNNNNIRALQQETQTIWQQYLSDSGVSRA